MHEKITKGAATLELDGTGELNLRVWDTEEGTYTSQGAIKADNPKTAAVDPVTAPYHDTSGEYKERHRVSDISPNCKDKASAYYCPKASDEVSAQAIRDQGKEYKYRHKDDGNGY